jgi:AraC-like DNA-binding protein
MIGRYRLQEAAERMAAARELDVAQIAFELGYADQAHFSRDFKRLIGKAPAEYFKSLLPMPQR